MSLSPDEIDRYARHLVLPEIGGAGQQKLKAATVLAMGAGGLGSPVLEYLAAAGVGCLRVVDDDVVAASNLQRQVIHSTPAIGQPKVASAAARIEAIKEAKENRKKGKAKIRKAERTHERKSQARCLCGLRNHWGHTGLPFLQSTRSIRKVLIGLRWRSG